MIVSQFSTNEKELIEKAFNFEGAPNLKWVFKNNPPCYISTPDFSIHTIEMQDFSQWKNFNGMFHTLLHEIGHSTMKTYRKRYKNDGAEELFAESFALFSCVLFDIEQDEENTLAYIKSWFKDMKNNKGKALNIFHKALNISKQLYGENK